MCIIDDLKRWAACPTRLEKTPMNYTHVAIEILRALRGKRSRVKLSQTLGYKSNVVFDWETGRREAKASAFFGVAQAVGIDVGRAIDAFHPTSGSWHLRLSPASSKGVQALLNDLRGKQAIGELSQALGVSRFIVSRWLTGHTEPKLADLLRFIDKSSLRLLDFVACLLPPERVPTLARPWRELSLARNLAYDAPWSHAILRVLESAGYLALPRHVPGFIARRLAISEAEERRCMDLLSRAAQISWHGQHWRIDESRTVDTRHDPRRSRQLRAFWSRVATERIESGTEGELSFNLCGVSNADLERLRQLQRSYFLELRSIVARSAPVEQVILVNLQLLPLSTA